MTCETCRKYETYADGKCAGCAYPAERCRCLPVGSTVASGKRKLRSPASPSRAKKAPRGAAPRLPTSQRAGTRLLYEPRGNVIPVLGRTDRGVKEHGYIDRRQRIYQCGGELSNFVYWKDDLMSFAEDVWHQINAGGVDMIEVVDHTRNRVFRLSIQRAREGHWYESEKNSIGRRWGVPFRWWPVEHGVEPAPKGEPLDPPAEVPAQPPLL